MRKGKDVHNRGSASGRSQNVKFFKNRLTAQDVHYFRMEGVLNKAFFQFPTSVTMKENFFFQAWELWKAGRSQELSDCSPGSEHERVQITRCVHIALLCIQECPANRPTMPDVLLMLCSQKAVLPEPKMPENHTNEGLADILTLERLWEANVPLHPHK
jgi:hypothetical protein